MKEEDTKEDELVGDYSRSFIDEVQESIKKKSDFKPKEKTISKQEQQERDLLGTTTIRTETITKESDDDEDDDQEEEGDDSPPLSLSGIGSRGVGVTTLAITFAVAFLVFGQINEAVQEDGTVVNTTTELYGFATEVPGFIPIIMIVAIGAMIITLVGRFGRFKE